MVQEKAARLGRFVRALTFSSFRSTIFPVNLSNIDDIERVLDTGHVLACVLWFVVRFVVRFVWSNVVCNVRRIIKDDESLDDEDSATDAATEAAVEAAVEAAEDSIVIFSVEMERKRL